MAGKTPGIEDIFPLTPAQQGMLFHALAEPEAALYLTQFEYEVEGPLDPERFARACQLLLDRHPSLRAAFNWQTRAGPVQVVRPEVRLPFVFEDWASLGAEEQTRRFGQVVEEERRRGVDFGKAPLLRIHLFRTGPERHLCLWTAHHLIADGWSQGLLLREVSELHAGLRTGVLPPPPSRPLRAYFEWLKQQPTAPMEAFWREALRGVEPSGGLGIERPAVPGRMGPFEAVRFTLRPEVSAGLKALLSRSGLTLSAAVQGIWALVMGRYTQQDRVLFGITVSGRPAALPGIDEAIGCFMNTLPVVAELRGEQSVLELLKARQAWFAQARVYEHSALLDVQRWAGLPRGRALFETVLMFDGAAEQEGREELTFRALESGRAERTNFPLSIRCEGGERISFILNFDRARYEAPAIERLARQLETAIERFVARPETRVRDLDILPDSERARLAGWNATDRERSSTLGIHRWFEQQVDRTPDAMALTFEERSLTYRELDARANQVARRLLAHGVGAGSVVGVCVERSPEMVAALLGVLKAGAAYLPLDPGYPPARLRWMVEDSGASLLLMGRRLASLAEALQPERRALTCWWVDAAMEAFSGERAERPQVQVSDDALAYVIYTSGSTGRPKGVMVTHRGVDNFITAMDGPVGTEEPRVWAAVTSVSFDIAALELWWTLARGFHVILHGPEPLGARSASRGVSARTLSFSLYYFSAEDSAASSDDPYRLLMEGARFADAHGFEAVWTPERHFHPFGGLFPNPSVLSAALAGITQRVHLRAGSVVAPLHHPARIAEEWAVVDRLSKGRVGVAFASGWHSQDFVLAPEHHANRREVMRSHLEAVRRLWRGEPVSFPGVDALTEVRVHPRPVQSELPVWLTTGGSLETCRLAGELGAHLLTHLLGQQVDALAECIRAYREAWRQAGHPGEGRVTLMVHTFLDGNHQRALDTVREPFLRYLRSSVDLLSRWAGSLGEAVPQEPEALERLLSRSFERYARGSALFGSPERCMELVEQLREAGVDEVACLIDFGVDTDTALRGLTFLDELRRRAEAPADHSLPAQLRRHGVGYLQCTPSLAQALTAEPETASSLASLKRILLGGEALPPALVRRLHEVCAGEVVNMYGPTEATIWSSARRIERGFDRVTLGGPIDNTRFVVVDKEGRLAPIGVAGELLIGGEGLARGYLGRPELTAERFVPDAWTGRSGERLYRTGDVVRWLETGELEFLGRLDHQVKIRGHRIELGEIEAVLTRHPGVREAVVVAREDEPGQKRLVAYVVSDSGEGVGPELRELLRRELPEYMLPSAFVSLEALPLTPNGKVDRSALPAPEGLRPHLRSEFRAPETATERALAAIWSEVLKVSQVGVDDDFFELGGDSILTLQVSARARKAGLAVEPGDVFRNPTVAMLARVADAAASQSVAPPAAHPLTAAQLAVLGEAQRPDGFEGLVLTLKDAPDAERVRRAVGALVERHEALRLRFARTDAGWRQFSAKEALDGFDARTLPAGADLDAELRELGTRVLEGPSPFRVRLLPPSGNRPATLLLAAHPLAVDGRSLQAVGAELLDALERPIADGARTARVLSFLEWAARAVAPEPAEHESFWREQVGESLPLANGPEGEAGWGPFSELRTALSREETTRLARRAEEALHARPEELMLAAVAQALYRWLGPRPVVVEVDGSGRHPFAEADPSRTVGRFSLALPLRVELSRAASPVDALRMAKECHRGVPVQGLTRKPGTPPGPILRVTGAVGSWQLRPGGGPLDTAWTMASRREGSHRHPLVLRYGIQEGELRLRWSYSPRALPESRVESLAAAALEVLRAHLVEEVAAPVIVPSDFPEAQLDQAGLERLMKSLVK